MDRIPLPHRILVQRHGLRRRYMEVPVVTHQITLINERLALISLKHFRTMNNDPSISTYWGEPLEGEVAS